MERGNNDLGNDRSTALVNQLRTQVDKVIRSKEVNLGREVKEQVHSLFFQLTMVYQLIGFIKHHNENFGRYQWKDSARARQLLNQGVSKINNQPTTEELRPIVISLIELLPEEERGGLGQGLLG